MALGGTAQNCSFTAGKKNPLELDPATEKTMQSALDVQSTFPAFVAFSHCRESPHSALGLRHVETTTPASRIQAHPVKQFPESSYIVVQSACQVEGRSPRRLQRFHLKSRAEAGLTPIFAKSMRIIPCPEVTVVDVQHTITRKTCFVCPQYDIYVYKDLLCSVLIS
jgi:hypothetical protein